MKYSIAFRNSVLKKVLPPESRPVTEVAQECGLTSSTIHLWMKKAKSGTLSQEDGEIPPLHRSAAEKFRILLESRNLDENQKGEWLRAHGLHTEHLAQFEQELVNIMTDKTDNAKSRERALLQENRQLKQELNRKDKAIAELTTLLALKKKLEMIFQDREADSSSQKSGSIS